MQILFYILLLTSKDLIHGQRESPSTNSSEVDVSENPTLNLINLENELPKIINKETVIKAIKGDRVILPCKVIRLDTNGVIWSKNNETLWIMRGNPVRFEHVTTDNRIGRYNTSLVIRSVTDDDSGVYICKLPKRPNQKILQKLEISVPPTVMPLNGSDYVEDYEGVQVEFGCSATGKPNPKITWKRENGEQINGVANNGVITIKSILPEDAGVYICTASNGIGNDAMASISLNVQYPPKVIAVDNVVYTGVNYDAILYCVVKASPFPNILWFKGDFPVNQNRLKKGYLGEDKFSLTIKNVIAKDIGIYSCNASNVYGNESAIIELTGRPLHPIITSSEDGDFPDQYALTWEVESYSPVIHYDVFFRNETENSDTWINVTIPGASSSSIFHSKLYLLKNLMPGFPIEVKVRAVNEFGESSWSNNFAFRTFDPGDNMTTIEESVNESTTEAMIVPILELEDAEGVITFYDPEFSTAVFRNQNISPSALSSSIALTHTSEMMLLGTIILLLR